MLEHHTTTLNGLEFSFLASGPKNGEPVILLHGFPQFADAWTPLLEHLGSLGFRAVALDQRGYSVNARPQETEAYGLIQLTSDVIALADSLTWPAFHLIGHDWGGILVWSLAATHPHRVPSVSVLSTAHVDAFLNAVQSDPAQQSRSRYLQFFKMPGHVAEAFFLDDDAMRLRAVFQAKLPETQIALNVHRLQQPGALTAALNWYRALDLDARIGPVNVPALYLWGDQDMALGRAAAEATAHYVKAPYEFQVLAGRSHWLQEEVPDTVAALVIQHLTNNRLS